MLLVTFQVLPVDSPVKPIDPVTFMRISNLNKISFGIVSLSLSKRSIVSHFRYNNLVNNSGNGSG